MSHFLYKLIPPRPTFGPGQMTDAEAATMEDHAAYWVTHVQSGAAVVYGPVLDPTGNWGIAIVEADAEDDVARIRDADPAITSGLASAEILPMPVAILAGAAG